MVVPLTSRIDLGKAAWLAVVATIVSVLLVLRVVQASGVDAQAIGWPTPPPGLPFPVPAEEQISAPITRSVERDGSEVEIVRPSWPGGIPLIPPVPSTVLGFESEDSGLPPIEIIVDAGTFPSVAQVRVTSADIGGLPETHDRVVWAFSIEVFDESGDPVRASPQRPLKVTLPVGGLIAAGIRGSDLLFAQAVDGRLVPMVTSFDLTTQSIWSLLLRVGTVVVVESVF